jgi:hypothetical protein
MNGLQEKPISEDAQNVNHITSIEKKRKTRPLLNRFKEKILYPIDSSCWIWNASYNGEGKRYGQIKVNNKMIKAHRVSYELFKGVIPEGKYVLHKCDNGHCVNPDHLFLGDQFDNMQDCVRKGRHANGKGSLNNNSKLLETDVLFIKQNCKLFHKVFGLSALARKYNVTPTTIWQIINNKSWANIFIPDPKKTE